jgi:hypothetical protein
MGCRIKYGLVIAVNFNDENIILLVCLAQLN